MNQQSLNPATPGIPGIFVAPSGNAALGVGQMAILQDLQPRVANLKHPPSRWVTPNLKRWNQTGRRCSSTTPRGFSGSMLNFQVG